MTSTARLWAAFVAGATLVLVAGCTSSTADGPTSTDVLSVTVSPSVVDPSTPTSSIEVNASPSAVDSSTPAAVSSDISAQEAADRAAIEAQWAAFWETYVSIVRIPVDQRTIALDAVSVDPIKSRILADASNFDSEGLDNYGTVVPHVYSVDILDGNTNSILLDCQDQSGFGSLEVATGKKKTVGIANNHLQAGLVLGSDGAWRVQNVQYLENVPC